MSANMVRALEDIDWGTADHWVRMQARTAEYIPGSRIAERPWKYVLSLHGLTGFAAMLLAGNTFVTSPVQTDKARGG